MTEWNPDMDAAPRDGTHIRARTNGGAEFDALWVNGLVGRDENDCGGWAAVFEDESPACWSDGVCWEVNEDDVPSDPVTHWTLPQPPREGGE